MVPTATTDATSDPPETETPSASVRPARARRGRPLSATDGGTVEPSTRRHAPDHGASDSGGRRSL
jgi:hypothetical protein